jgi:hypothetical protein
LLLAAAGSLTVAVVRSATVAIGFTSLTCSMSLICLILAVCLTESGCFIRVGGVVELGCFVELGCLAVCLAVCLTGETSVAGVAIWLAAAAVGTLRSKDARALLAATAAVVTEARGFLTAAFRLEGVFVLTLVVLDREE